MRRVVFISQAPARPGSRHGTPGAYVRPWLYQIGLDEATINKYFRFYALMGSFPGAGNAGHHRPTTEQMSEHRPILIELIREFQPGIIVPVGCMAIAGIIPSASNKLSETIGKSYTSNPFDCLPEPIIAIPLPHPSGRSTWLHQYPSLLSEALSLLQRTLN